MSEIIGSNETLVVSITTSIKSFASERRFASSLTISELKAKLELITGASHQSMKLQLLDINHDLIADLDDNSRQLKSYLTDNESKVNIHVIDNTVSADEFEDVSRVEKFELPQELYEQRTDSVLAFKQRNKLGRFGQTDATAQSQPSPTDISVGHRCEVQVKGSAKRRATVMFVGNTRFKSGLWVGVRYDEPLGKNDGSVEGIRYFDCKPKYGGFVRPEDMTVGDFPEIGINSDDEVMD